METIQLMIFILMMVIFLFIMFFIFIGRKFKRLINDMKQMQMEQQQLAIEMKEMMEKHELDQQEIWKKEVRHLMRVKALDVRDAVYKQTKAPHPRAISAAPKAPGIADTDLVNALDEDQLQALQQIFSLFQHYIHTYWETKKGGVKTVFTGLEEDPKGEVAVIRRASNQLLHQIDQLMVKL